MFAHLFSKKLQSFRVFPLKSCSWFSRTIINHVHSFTQSKQRRPVRRVNRLLSKSTKSVPKQDIDLPKVFMRDTVTRISHILRFSTWDSAQEQLMELPIKWDSYTVNQVLKTHPPMEKAWLFFSWASKLKGFKHDQFTYTTMLDIFGEAGRISSMNYIFQQMQDKGIKIDAVTYTSLLHWLSDHGDINESIKLWQDMKDKGCVPNVVCYTAYMKGLFDHNRVKEGAKIYKEMLQSGCSPNCHTYTVLMEHLASSGKFDGVLEIFSKMQDAGVQPDKATCSILVGKCCKAGETQAMMKILHYMKENFLVLRYSVYQEAFHTLKMAGVNCSCGRVNGAFLAFKVGVKLGITIERIAYLTMVGELIRTNSFSRVVDIVEAMVGAGLSLGSELTALLIHRLGCARELASAEKLFSILPDQQKSIAVYTALINTCFTFGNADKGLEIFETMRKQGINLALSTYCVLLNGLERNGLFDKLQSYRKEKKRFESESCSREMSMEETFSLSLEAVAAGMIGQMGLDSLIILVQHYGLKEWHSSTDFIKVVLLEVESNISFIYAKYACCKMVTLDALRALIFGAIWVLFGKRVWFFPNILAEEATLQDLLQVWPQKDEAERPKWTARLFYAIVAVVVILLLRHHAPDEAARARYQKRVSSIIDDVLKWSPRQALSGMMDTVVNATDSNDNACN
ncbi:hypothetical protein H5410_000632 [Solanum commersonii]|uniref:Pentatricopeptide repeat-containing protein n=1 Tax=Solanum commersonii TaxID=4109 RepID=A0A9J6AXH3_SOLCO|nr:hypothetical protein H5410_000632 [Solanum commersonii]